MVSAYAQLRRQYRALSAEGHSAGARGSLTDDLPARFAALNREIAELRGSGRWPGASSRQRGSTAGAGSGRLKRLPSNWRRGAHPNRNPVYGQLPSEESTASLSVWVIDEIVVTGMLALIGLSVLGLLAHKAAEKWTCGSLENHQALSLFVVGLVWWTCLSVSVMGMLLVLSAGYLAVKSPRQRGGEDFVMRETARGESSEPPPG